MNVKEYLDQKGLVYRTVDSPNGVQYNLKVCPFCQDSRYHFYISSKTGLYFCHHGSCGAAGSFLTFKKKLGDLMEPTSFADMDTSDQPVGLPDDKLNEVLAAHERLLNDKETLWYLSSRAFTLEAVKYFKLGVVEEDGVKWLLIPSFSQGKLANVKLRTLPPAAKRFRRWSGGISCLFNEQALHVPPAPNNSIILCEGETDCIALWSKGIRNVIGVTLGASGVKAEWIKLLDKFQTVYFAYDNDMAGEIGAKKFATRLGLARCKQVRLPPDVKDVNEYFIKGHKAQDFLTLLNNADDFEVENVQSIGSVIRQHLRNVFTNNVDNKLTLHWKNVNKLLDGIVPGDLIVIGGRPGTGKSTLSFNILYEQAKRGVPGLLFSLEMPLWRLLPRIVALHKRIDSKLCNDTAILMDTYRELRNVPLYFAYKYDRPSWSFISDTIRAAVKYHNIQLVVFDNLHFLCRSLSHQTEEVSVMTQNFSLLAKELNIPIILIARPRKTSSKIISGEDLKDSADVEGDADVILIIHRDRKKSVSGEEIEGNFEPVTMIIADKVRYSAGGTAFLVANDAEARFDELTTK